MSKPINDFIEFKRGEFIFLKRLRDIKEIHQNKKSIDDPVRLLVFEYDGKNFYADNAIKDIEIQIKNIEFMNDTPSFVPVKKIEDIK
jgi:hypothetical protein